MRYLVRLNPRAYNPITKVVDPARVWEVEQSANKDSEKVVWHCAEVTVDGKPIQQLIVFGKVAIATKPENPEMEFFGIVRRAQDNAIEILQGRHDVTYGG